MTQRITMRHLKVRIDEINMALGTPLEAYTRKQDGSLSANIGHHFIENGYNGYGLAAIVSLTGGERRPIGHQLYTKRVLLDILDAYLAGIRAGHTKAMETVRGPI